jgi:hypothetical protein
LNESAKASLKRPEEGYIKAFKAFKETFKFDPKPSEYYAKKIKKDGKKKESKPYT